MLGPIEISLLLYVMSFCYGLFIFLILVGWFQIKQSDVKSKAALSSFSIIIPFRNESENLGALIDSLRQQEFNSALDQIFLVDDHSTDNSNEIILKLKGELPISILKNTNAPGKKGSLETGWSQTSSSWIIQLDSDVTLGKNWFKSIQNGFQSTASLHILPVTFKGNTFLQKAFNFEFMSLAMTTFGTLGLNQPILANGAHMMYRNINLTEISEREDWKRTASGDDIAILSYFKEKKKKIASILNQGIIIETVSKQTFKEFIEQRLRWSSKTKYKLISLNGFIAIFILFFSLVFSVNLALSPFVSNKIILEGIFVFFGIKIIADLLFYIPILFFFNKLNQIWMYFVLIPLYPLYVLILGILGIFGLGTWKRNNSTIT